MTTALRFYAAFLSLVSVLAASPAFSQAIPSAIYAWGHSPPAGHTDYQEQTLLEGTTRDFSHLTVQAVTLPASQPAQPAQQFDEEAILIVKAGAVTLTLGGKRKTLGPGSVVMIMPGDEYQVENKAAQPLSYYLIRYTSNQMPDVDLYRLVGESFWVDRQEVVSTADHQGDDQLMFTCATVMSSRVVMQVTTLDPGARSLPPHTHRAAELLLILDHPVQAYIDGSVKRAQPGDVVFVESDVPHRIEPTLQKRSTYVSLQF